MRSFREYLPTYLKRLEVLSGPKDIAMFRRLRANKVRNSDPVALRIRELGNREVWCRPGTQDTVVLWATFHGRG